MQNNNPKITYRKEINAEYDKLTDYGKLRSQINKGKTLPYAEYVHERAKVYIDQMANKSQLLELRAILDRALIVYGELPPDRQAR